MTTASERIERYLEIHGQISNLDHEKLHRVTTSDGDATLLASDLRDILGVYKVLAELAKRALDIETVLESHLTQEGVDLEVRLPNGSWADMKDVLNGNVHL